MGFIRTASLVLVTMGVLLGTTATATATAAPGPADGLAYVALGDSYAAGYGLTPPTGKPVSGCGQSASDYPHRVAKALGLRLSDVTCSGAETADIVSAAQRVGAQSAPPQSRALSRATRVVTVTIGGNDLGFFDTVASCVALSAHGPILRSGRPNCRASFVGTGGDILAIRIRSLVRGRLDAAFAAIKSDAPNAKVFVVGYPALMPDAVHTPAAGCFAGSFTDTAGSLSLTNAFPYTDTDVAYLHSIEVALDRATRSSALHSGFDYISVLAGSEAHTPCGKTPWMNGITLSSRKRSFALTPGALHPNALGAAHLADSVIPAIRRSLARSSTTPAPAPPERQGSPARLLVAVALGLIILLLLAAAARFLARRRHTVNRE